MASLSTIIAKINKLSASDKVKLKNYLMGTSPSKPSSLASFVGKERFTGGFVCPICDSKHIVRFGHRTDGAQRYRGKALEFFGNLVPNDTSTGSQKHMRTLELNLMFCAKWHLYNLIKPFRNLLTSLMKKTRIMNF